MSVSEPPPAPRRRNAAATRQAILTSARRAFARSGYDGAGLREIARDAGVTAMLIGRYFGSKEQLFAEVAADTMAPPSVLSQAVLDLPGAGEIIASGLVALTHAEAAPLDGFLIMVHSASSQRAAEIGRAQIEEHHLKTLITSLAGDLAAERAALILSLITGFQVMRQMIALSPLAEAGDEDLVRLLAPMFQGLIDAGRP